jgi:hypothetical protein
VFAYTNAITRPIKITGAMVRATDDNETPVEILTDRNEFMTITDKESYGETQKIYYDPLSVNGKLFVWPVCGTSEITDRLILSTTRTIQDLDSGGNNFDLPNETLMAVMYGLADELQPEYGLMNNLITAKAVGYYERLKKTYKAKSNFFLIPRR